MEISSTYRLGTDIPKVCFVLLTRFWYWLNFLRHAYIYAGRWVRRDRARTHIQCIYLRIIIGFACKWLPVLHKDPVMNMKALRKAKYSVIAGSKVLLEPSACTCTLPKRTGWLSVFAVFFLPEKRTSSKPHHRWPHIGQTMYMCYPWYCAASLSSLSPRLCERTFMDIQHPKHMPFQTQLTSRVNVCTVEHTLPIWYRMHACQWTSIK